MNTNDQIEAMSAYGASIEAITAHLKTIIDLDDTDWDAIKYLVEAHGYLPSDAIEELYYA